MAGNILRLFMVSDINSQIIETIIKKYIVFIPDNSYCIHSRGIDLLSQNPFDDIPAGRFQPGL
jgi:hypothetical protein